MFFTVHIENSKLEEWNKLIINSSFKSEWNSYQKNKALENLANSILTLINIIQPQAKVVSKELTHVIVEQLNQEAQNFNTVSEALILAKNYICKFNYITQLNNLLAQKRNIQLGISGLDLERTGFKGATSQPWRLFSQHRYALRVPLASFLVYSFYFLNERYVSTDSYKGKTALIGLQFILAYLAHRLDYLASPTAIKDSEKNQQYKALETQIKMLKDKIATIDHHINLLSPIVKEESNLTLTM